jgi:hypothetical protein
VCAWAGPPPRWRRSPPRSPVRSRSSCGSLPLRPQLHRVRKDSVRTPPHPVTAALRRETVAGWVVNVTAQRPKPPDVTSTTTEVVDVTTRRRRRRMSR